MSAGPAARGLGNAPADALAHVPYQPGPVDLRKRTVDLRKRTVDLRKRTVEVHRFARLSGWWDQTFAGHSWRRARDVDVLTHIFALIAQLVLCAAPLLIAASAVVRRAGGQGLGPPLTHFLGLDRDAAATVNTLFATSNLSDFGDLVLGLVISALLGTGVAATQQRGYTLIWGLPAARWHSIWRHVVWTLVVAGYTATLLAASEWSFDVDEVPGLGLLIRCGVTLISSVLFYTWESAPAARWPDRLSPAAARRRVHRGRASPCWSCSATSDSPA